MVNHGVLDDRQLTLSIKPNCLTISLEGGKKGQEVYSFDLSGRLWTALLKDVSYRRGLDGKVVAKWITLAGERKRRWLSPVEADDMQTHTNNIARKVMAAHLAGELNMQMPLDEPGIRALEAAVQFDLNRAKVDVSNYYQTYKPVGILPPDQYMAVVLQATEGCSFNSCSFCDFYRDRPFRIKTPEEFSQHAQGVKKFLGEGMNLRRTIFLGDANALAIPMKKLEPLVEVVHHEYDVQKLGGIFAFIDGFSGERKRSSDYAALVKQGFQRVYVGLESGCNELLKFLKKPGSAEDTVRAVREMKVGGLAVGVIVLLGAGGKTYQARHVRDTIAAINTMQLGIDDLLFFSELIAPADLEYTRQAYQANLQPLNMQERIKQQVMIEEELIFSPDGGTPHISRYDIREFIY